MMDEPEEGVDILNDHDFFVWLESTYPLIYARWSVNGQTPDISESVYDILDSLNINYIGDDYKPEKECLIENEHLHALWLL